MNEHRSEQPPHVRQTELKEDGTLVTTDYDRRGHIVKQTFYRSSDKRLLMRILASLQADARAERRLRPLP